MISNKLYKIFRCCPSAVAVIKGNENYPIIKGRVSFFDCENSVIVCAEISGLPKSAEVCDKPIFAFHIHSGTECTGKKIEPFSNTKGHFNPEKCPHPYHAGDMPPLFSVNGGAFLCFMTNRFKVKDILGKTVIIHSKPDDFTTQPSGNSGEKIACGIIRRFYLKHLIY